MPEVKLTAELRTEFGKGAARRIRRAHKVPAVLYGHGTDPIHIALPGHETLLALRTDNALLSIDVNGTSSLALPKQVQRDPIKHTIEHVDLVLVRRGEKVTVEVNVVIEGEATPGSLVTQDSNTIEIEADALSIPQQLSLSIEGADIGTQFTAVKGLGQPFMGVERNRICPANAIKLPASFLGQYGRPAIGGIDV